MLAVVVVQDGTLAPHRAGLIAARVGDSHRGFSSASTASLILSARVLKASNTSQFPVEHPAPSHRHWEFESPQSQHSQQSVQELQCTHLSSSARNACIALSWRAWMSSVMGGSMHKRAKAVNTYVQLFSGWGIMLGMEPEPGSGARPDELGFWDGLRCGGRHPGRKHVESMGLAIGIPPKRMDYILKKWERAGLWQSGTALRGGWFPDLPVER